MKQNLPIALALRCFRVQARRSQFRRRQTSSRLATFAEAFSSIAWAATTALAASAWAALDTAFVSLGVLAVVWLISPSRALGASAAAQPEFRPRVN
jgi:hypothetical protein